MRTFTIAAAALALLAFTAPSADAQVIVRSGYGYPAYNTYYAPSYGYSGYAYPAYTYGSPYRYGGYAYPYSYGGSGISFSTGNFAFSYGTPAYGYGGYGGYGGPRYYGRRWR